MVGRYIYIIKSIIKTGYIVQYGVSQWEQMQESKKKQKLGEREEAY